jgi:glutamate-1-semialdehyde aminotransferase
MTIPIFNMDNQWLPFTPNRSFKKDPRVFTAASGMHFTTPDGRQVLDGISSLWCVGAGHNVKPINEAARYLGLRYRFPSQQPASVQSSRNDRRHGAWRFEQSAVLQLGF